MNLVEWLLVGMIIGVVSTAWQEMLSVKNLILSVIIGTIGAVSGGVMGYILYGASIDGFDFSIFSIALMLTTLITIGRRKVVEVVHGIRQKITAQSKTGIETAV